MSSDDETVSVGRDERGNIVLTVETPDITIEAAMVPRHAIGLARDLLVAVGMTRLEDKRLVLLHLQLEQLQKTWDTA